MQIKLKMETKKRKIGKGSRRYRELLKRLKWTYLDRGGEKGTWKEYAAEKGIYYTLRRYEEEITCEDDLEKILAGIYVSKGGNNNG